MITFFILFLWVYEEKKKKIIQHSIRELDGHYTCSIIAWLSVE